MRTERRQNTLEYDVFANTSPTPDSEGFNERCNDREAQGAFEDGWSSWNFAQRASCVVVFCERDRKMGRCCHKVGRSSNHSNRRDAVGVD
jgi:hypothetical protein